MSALLRRFALAALTATACIYTYRADSSETRSYSAADVANITVSTRNGEISVSAGDDSTITALIQRHAYGRDKEDAEKALENVVIDDTVLGGTLSIVARMPSGNRSYGAAFSLAAPASVDLNLSTSNGALSIQSIRGDVQGSTSNGAVSLEDVTGDATVSTSNGAVTANGHRGTLEASTTNGAMNCDIAELTAVQSVDLSTTNGSVTLYLPSDVSATVECQNSNADILFVNFPNIEFTLQEEHHKRAVIGTGASDITVTTTNAAVTIRGR